MQKALICGAGAFIGGHLVKRLKQEGIWVRGVDLKFNEYSETVADDFIIGDLRDQALCRAAIDTRFDEVYQLAADMGGAGFIFTGEKAPAAICRKVAMAKSGESIEIWGDSKQTRSFLFVDECLEGTTRLLRSNFEGPVNIGSEEMVTINQLVDVVADIAGKRIEKRHIDGPQGGGAWDGWREFRLSNVAIYPRAGWFPRVSWGSPPWRIPGGALPRLRGFALLRSDFRPGAL